MRVWLSQLWNDWRSALPIVKPDIVIAWHPGKEGKALKWFAKRLEDPLIAAELLS